MLVRNHCLLFLAPLLSICPLFGCRYSRAQARGRERGARVHHRYTPRYRRLTRTRTRDGSVPAPRVRVRVGNTTGTGNPHGSHDGYRAGTGTGMVLLTRAYTHTRGTGLHTRHSLPPHATTMMQRRRRLALASSLPTLTCDDDGDDATTAPRPSLVLTHPDLKASPESLPHMRR